MLVDPAMLQMLKELRLPGQSDPVVEILQVFEADGKRTLWRLDLAIRNLDAKGAHEAAHRLKGSAANLGAIAIQARYQIIETATKDGDLPDNLEDQLDGLMELFVQTVKELKVLAET